MAFLETCFLCLSKEPNTVSMESENEDLRRKIDKIFYFKVIRNEDVPSLVCADCKETIEAFFEYAEQVHRNHKMLEITIVALPKKEENLNDSVKIEIRSDDDETVEVIQYDEEDGVMVKTYLETSIGLEFNVQLEEEPSERNGDVSIKSEYASEREEEASDREEEASEKEEEASEKQEEASEKEEEAEKDENCLAAGKRKRKCTQRKNIVKGKQQKSEETKPDRRFRSEISPGEAFVLQHYKLACDLCSEPLEDFTVLQKHYRKVHKERGYMNCCNKKISKRISMVDHLQLHINPNVFHCKICNKSYSSSSVLREHTNEVHAPDEKRNIKCETCLKAFVSEPHLYAHKLVAHGSVQCPQCPKVLASQGSLKSHLVAMHGEGEQFVCDICAQVYRTKQCFEAHVQRHLGTRHLNKVQCHICSVWFMDKNCLTKHTERMHPAKEVTLACELCDKVFRSKHTFRCHVNRTHSEGRFECDFCQKKFKRPHQMREHVAVSHTGEDLYECDYCPERFNTKNKKYVHRKTVHPDEFQEEMRKRIMKDI